LMMSHVPICALSDSDVITLNGMSYRSNNYKMG
jgi:hypothetical protein